MSKYKQIKQEIKTVVRNALISGHSVVVRSSWDETGTTIVVLNSGEFETSRYVKYEHELVKKWIKEVEEEQLADVVK